MLRSLALALAGLLSFVPGRAAEFAISAHVLRSASVVPPLGVNNWGRCGAVEWAANNFVKNSGNEPVVWRNLHRVAHCGPGWFEIDSPGTSVVRPLGQRLPLRRGRAHLPPRRPGRPHPAGAKRHARRFQCRPRAVRRPCARDPRGQPRLSRRRLDRRPLRRRPSQRPPRPRQHHLHRRFGPRKRPRLLVHGGRARPGRHGLLPPSNEASATPRAGLDTPPHQMVVDANDRLPDVRAGRPFEFAPRARGGTAAAALVAGGRHPARGTLARRRDRSHHRPSRARRAHPAHRAAGGRRAPDAPTAAPTAARRRKSVRPEKNAEFQPPGNLRAVAGDGCVTLTWDPSPSPEVVAYRIRRSVAPAARQEERVYLAAGAPELHPWDYIVLSRKFDPFKMKYVNSRVRGIGNPMDAPGWYWNSEGNVRGFSSLPHPEARPRRDDRSRRNLPPDRRRRRPAAHLAVRHDWHRTRQGVALVRAAEPGREYPHGGLAATGRASPAGQVEFSFAKGYPELH